MRARLGLDQPLIVQYLNWLTQVVQGDLGSSITHRTPALAVILQRLVPTMYLMVGGLIMAVISPCRQACSRPFITIPNGTTWPRVSSSSASRCRPSGWPWSPF